MRGQQANGFGGVKRGAAAECDHAIAAGGLIGGGAVQHVLFGGIRIDFGEDGGLGRESTHASEHGGALDAFVGDKERAANIAFFQLFRQARDGAWAENDGGRERESGEVHQEVKIARGVLSGLCGGRSPPTRSGPVACRRPDVCTASSGRGSAKGARNGLKWTRSSGRAPSQ